MFYRVKRLFICTRVLAENLLFHNISQLAYKTKLRSMELPVPVPGRGFLQQVLHDHNELRKPLDRFHHQTEKSKPKSDFINLKTPNITFISGGLYG